jgi:uncharacterized circularly permuted ATP-grasp superfamily protein
MTIRWRDYKVEGIYDEVMKAAGRPRGHARLLTRYLASLDEDELFSIQAAAELSIKEMGITFTVYSQTEGSIDRAWPLDVIPRVMAADEWRRIESGLKQRVHALNLFINDIYHYQQIVKDGKFPREVLAKSVNFRKDCVGVDPPQGVWAHICGSDLVRDSDGTVYVLEDNLRVPSGVSYMLENRQVVKRVFPELFENGGILPVDDYPSQLFDCLAALSPRRSGVPEVVVLTPGIYNSAYFEHSYIAQQMGCELVEGGDLHVSEDNVVYMRTIEGLSRVDVIYRRIDDLFLDPEAFRKDSMLGVPGLMRAWKAGNVALANAPGAGYYLDEDPILPNVPTYLCTEKESRDHVLENLTKMVVKPANESGGYGMLVGPVSTKKERDAMARRMKKDPRNFIAQPVITLSTVPSIVGKHVEPRHVDLRPFILSSDQMYVTTGGLTRVAMRRGSLVVNSSQGGGSKDTWIVDGGGV